MHKIREKIMVVKNEALKYKKVPSKKVLVNFVVFKFFVVKKL